MNKIFIVGREAPLQHFYSDICKIAFFYLRHFPRKGAIRSHGIFIHFYVLTRNGEVSTRIYEYTHPVFQFSLYAYLREVSYFYSLKRSSIIFVNSK